MDAAGVDAVDVEVEVEVGSGRAGWRATSPALVTVRTELCGAERESTTGAEDGTWWRSVPT